MINKRGYTFFLSKNNFFFWNFNLLSILVDTNLEKSNSTECPFGHKKHP